MTTRSEIRGGCLVAPCGGGWLFQALDSLLRRAVSRRPVIAFCCDAQKAAGPDAGTASERLGRRGVLLASGLIVGESLMGVLLAGIIGATGNQAPLAVVGEGFEGTAVWLGLAAFVLICAGFYGRVLKHR